jgi:predicted HTH transcriptional regulator
MFLINHILQEGDEVALFVPSNLHHFIGHYQTEQMTTEELQKEYDFHIAEGIVKMLYKEGKITADELHKISALNREKFSPRLAEIMS